MVGTNEEILCERSRHAWESTYFEFEVLETVSFETRQQTHENWLRYSQKDFYTQLQCMFLPFSPYLCQILTKLLEPLTSLQKIKVSIHICDLNEVILLLFGTINFTTKTRSQPVWTGFFPVVDRLEPVFKGPVAVPEYLERSRPVAVASCLVLR